MVLVFVIIILGLTFGWGILIARKSFLKVRRRRKAILERLRQLES